MSEEPVDRETFRRLLGEELISAAYRRKQANEFAEITHNTQQTKTEPLHPAGRFRPLLIAACFAVVVGLVGLLWPSQAVADVFQISRLDDEIRLDIVDVVTDPAKVETQLREELGLASELIGLPVSPELVGVIVSVEAAEDMQLQLVVTEAGILDQIVLDVGFEGPIRIEYGRAANDGEQYQHTETASICNDLWGKRPDEVGGRLHDLDVALRYEIIGGQSGPYQTIEDLPDNYRLVDIRYLSANEAFVSFAAEVTVIPQHPNCQ